MFDEFLLNGGSNDSAQLLALLIIAFYFTAAGINVHYDVGIASSA